MWWCDHEHLVLGPLVSTLGRTQARKSNAARSGCAIGPAEVYSRLQLMVPQHRCVMYIRMFFFSLRFCQTWNKRYLIMLTLVCEVIKYRLVQVQNLQDFSGWRPAIAFLYLFLFHSFLRLTSFLSQNKNQYIRMSKNFCQSSWCTVWCSEIGSLTSLGACISGAFNDVREPVSLRQTVQRRSGLRKTSYFQLERLGESGARVQTGLPWVRSEPNPMDHERG